MQSQRDTLIARSRRAHAQQQISETMSNLPQTDTAGEFERFERRVRSTEARAAATAEVGALGLDDDFAALERDAGLDDELAALKSRHGGTSAGGQCGASTPPASTGGQCGASTPPASTGGQ